MTVCEGCLVDTGGEAGEVMEGGGGGGEMKGEA